PAASRSRTTSTPASRPTSRRSTWNSTGCPASRRRRASDRARVPRRRSDVNPVPYVVALAAVALILVARRLRDPAPKILLPLATAVIFVCGWQVAADAARYELRDKDGD